MKRTFVLVASVMVVTLISFACKKSTSTDPVTNTTTSTTGTSNTPTSTYSVNGVAQTGNLTLVKGPSTSPNVYKFILVGGSGGWGLGAIFSGTLTPSSGQYAMEDSTNTIPAGQCFFELTGSNGNNGGVATAGTLTVTTGATNTISFNNVLIPQPNGTGGTATTYTVSGAIRY